MLCYVGFILDFIVKICKRRRQRVLPLIKGLAVVCGKVHVSLQRNSIYQVTFRFPDGKCLPFYTGKIVYKELAEGDRVILKYKVVGKYKKPVFYSYERLEEKEVSP